MKINWFKIVKERLFPLSDSNVFNPKNSLEFLKYAEDNWKQIFGARSKKDMTIGEQRVRTTFNPSNDNLVDVIKQKSAWLIDICEQLKNKDARLASLAQTAYEEAAMWAVKAATTETPTD